MNATTERGTPVTASGWMTLSAPATAVAISTSELLRVANRELQREQKASKGNQRVILRSGVARLSAMGLVSKWERDRLDRICDLVLVGARSAKKGEDVISRLQAIYDEMIARDAGRLALTIAEVAATLDRLSGTPQTIKGRGVTAKAARETNVGHLMIGGIAGALAGAAAGGLPGAAIGFVAGWIGRGLVEGC